MTFKSLTLFSWEGIKNLLLLFLPHTHNYSLNITLKSLPSSSVLYHHSLDYILPHYIVLYYLLAPTFTMMMIVEHITGPLFPFSLFHSLTPHHSLKFLTLTDNLLEWETSYRSWLIFVYSLGKSLFNTMHKTQDK